MPSPNDVVAALSGIDCAIISMRSPKQKFNEIYNDYHNIENNFATLEFDANMGNQFAGAKRLVIIIDRMDNESASGFATLERRA